MFNILVIRDIIFFMMIFCSIFNNIPHINQFNLFSGFLYNNLAFYAVICSIIYSAYYQWKYKNLFVDNKKFILFFSAYFSIVTLSLLFGWVGYPYEQDILNEAIQKIDKLKSILGFLNNLGLNIDYYYLSSVWILVRYIKSILLDSFYSFGMAYVIYCWYRTDWKRGFEIFSSGIIYSLMFVIIYCSIEIPFLAGNQFAKEVLELITPYVHVIKIDGTWWPPLIWHGQLRSLFSEPSYFGNYLACVLPIIWIKLLKNEKNKLFYIALLFIISFMVFLTKARTAVAMFIGMNILLYIFLLKKKEWRKILMISFVTIFAFSSSLYFIDRLMDKKYDNNILNNNISVKSYINDNFTSLASGNQRSNGARYALLKSNIRIGLQQPLLGVGKGLSSGYIVDYFTDEEKNIGEVDMWVKRQQKEGILGCNLGALNEYVGRFAETGILGLLVFLLPFIYILYLIYINIVYNNSLIAICLILIGLLVSGMNVTINLMYSVWPILGLAYAAIYDIKNRRTIANELI